MSAALRTPRILKLLGILLIVAVGLIHLRGVLPHYRAAPYVGVLSIEFEQVRGYPAVKLFLRLSGRGCRRRRG